MTITRTEGRKWGRLRSFAVTAAESAVIAGIISTTSPSVALPAESRLLVSIYVYNGGNVPNGTLRRSEASAQGFSKKRESDLVGLTQRLRNRMAGCPLTSKSESSTGP